MVDDAQLVVETPDPLYLFLCRLRWVRLADLHAYEELKRATRHPNPDIRLVGEVFLAERFKQSSTASGRVVVLHRQQRRRGLAAMTGEPSTRFC